MAEIAVSVATSLAFSLLQGLVDPTRIEGQKGDTKDIPSSRYGDTINKIWGLGRCSGTLIWAVDKTQSTTTSGGKGQPEVTTYHYAGTFAYLIGEGELDLISIYLNNKLWWSIAPDATAEQITLNNTRNQYFTFYRGTRTQLADATIQSYEGSNNTPAYRGYSYIVFHGLPLDDYGGGFPVPNFEVINSPTWTPGSYTSIPLVTVLKEICLMAGVKENQLDLSGAIGIACRGFSSNNVQSARKLLEILQQVYFLHILQIGGQIVCKPYRQSISAVLENPSFLTIDSDPIYSCEVTDPNTLPNSFQLEYPSADKHLQNTSKYSNRYKTTSSIQDFLDTDSTLYDENNQQNLSVTTALSEDEGLTVVNQMLSIGLSRTRIYSFMAPMYYLKYALGDVIECRLPDGYREVLAIESVDLGANYALEMKAVSYDGAFADVSLINDGVSPTTPYGQGSGSGTNLLVFDIPIWNYTDNDSVLYTAIWGASASWSAAYVSASNDSGSTYQSFVTSTGASTVGKVDIIALDVPIGQIDEVSQLTFTLEPFSGTNVSTIDTDTFNLLRANMLIVENEIIQYKTATLVGPRQYRLTNLRRGLFGTAKYVAGHSVNAFLVILDTTIKEGVVPTTQLNLPVIIKAVTMGQNTASPLSTSVAITPVGNSIKPLPVANLRYFIQPNGSVTFDWNHQSRKWNAWINNSEQPNNNADNLPNSYKVEIYTIADQFVRAVSVTGETYTYPGATVVADLGSATTFKVKVFQFSTIVGLGFESALTVLL